MFLCFIILLCLLALKQNNFWWLCTGAFSLCDVFTLIPLSLALLLIVLTAMLGDLSGGRINFIRHNSQVYHECLMLLFKLQSDHCPLVDSGIVILKDTIPVRIPIPVEMKAITHNHHVSKLLAATKFWKGSMDQTFIIKCMHTSTEPMCLIIRRLHSKVCYIHYDIQWKSLFWNVVLLCTRCSSRYQKSSPTASPLRRSNRSRHNWVNCPVITL